MILWFQNQLLVMFCGYQRPHSNIMRTIREVQLQGKAPGTSCKICRWTTDVLWLLCGCFSSGALVKADGIMNSAMYEDMLLKTWLLLPGGSYLSYVHRQFSSQ